MKSFVESEKLKPSLDKEAALDGQETKLAGGIQKYTDEEVTVNQDEFRDLPPIELKEFDEGSDEFKLKMQKSEESFKKMKSERLARNDFAKLLAMILECMHNPESGKN